MDRSAVILGGGFSKRFGRNKGLVELAGKPLILHVVEKVASIADEVVVVASSAAQREGLRSLLPSGADVVIDKCEMQSPLVGAATGFETAQGKYSLLLPCDTPFISSSVLLLLLDLCINGSAAVPRWPNGYIEPFQAAYHTRSALAAAESALKERRLNMRSMILRMIRVRYISTELLRQIDSELLTFFNVNTQGDLKRAEGILKRRNSCSNS